MTEKYASDCGCGGYPQWNQEVIGWQAICNKCGRSTCLYVSSGLAIEDWERTNKPPKKKATKIEPPTKEYTMKTNPPDLLRGTYYHKEQDIISKYNKLRLNLFKREAKELTELQKTCTHPNET